MILWCWKKRKDGADVACPFDSRVAEKERDKIDHFQDLKVDVQKIWNCRRVSAFTIVIGALGTVSKHLKMWISKLGTPGIIALLQKACLLGTAKILRRTLDAKGYRRELNALVNKATYRCEACTSSSLS